MKENKATGHESTFLASYFFAFGTFLTILGTGQKMPFFENQISKVYSNTLKTMFGTKHYIFILYMTQIFISIFLFKCMAFTTVEMTQKKCFI